MLMSHGPQVTSRPAPATRYQHFICLMKYHWKEQTARQDAGMAVNLTVRGQDEHSADLKQFRRTPRPEPEAHMRPW